MPTIVELNWSQIINPYADPTEMGVDILTIPNTDGITSTVIHGSGFTYDLNGVPTGGTIASIDLVMNSNATILQSVADVAADMADLGTFVTDITALRNSIGWFAVIDQAAYENPLLVTPSQFVFLNSDGSYTVVNGSGFAVAGGQLSGTVSQVLHLASDMTVLPDSLMALTVSLAEGAAAMFNDLASMQSYLLMGTGDNTVSRLNSLVPLGDVLINADYVDHPGSDTIQGPVPLTYATYDLSAQGIDANFNTGIVTSGGDTDHFTTTTLLGLSGSTFDDIIVGNALGNTIWGSAGDDSLAGLGGDDLLNGGPGDDTLTGGTGIDTADYNGAAAAVAVDLRLTTAQNTGGAGIDTITMVENLAGSSFDDTLTGSGGSNTIDGGFGDDTIIGLNGNDMLLGSAGNDTIAGGNGDDTINGGVGNDNIDGGNNVDTVDFSGDNATGDVTFSLTIRTAQDTGGAGTDTVIRVENITGSLFNDHLTGSGMGNTIDGGDGNDVISGLNGNDLLLGNAGNDTIYGGNDNDDVQGGDGSDRLLGGNGSDTLAGGNDNDTIKGDAGVDRIVGGLGRDMLYGGADADTFVFTSVADSTVAVGGRDVIWDFAQGIDHIDLSAIAISPTTGEINVNLAGDYTRVSVDVDGNGTTDMQFDLFGHFNLQAADFIV